MKTTIKIVRNDRDVPRDTLAAAEVHFEEAISMGSSCSASPCGEGARASLG
jgi:hypothetical protein